jgi:hypothetical protein
MNSLIEFLKQHEGTVFVNEDVLRSEFSLLPALSEDELVAISRKLPCPIPEDIRELLMFASGFEGTWMEQISFAPVHGFFGFEKIFPHAVELANDGAGNYWVVDLTKESQCWGPIFFACHDAPVIVYQADDLLHFVREVVREGSRPWRSEIGDVRGRFSDQIWNDNPGVLSFSHCVNSLDQELKSFAESLDETWLFVDLRNPLLGDGFSWGRYGPKTNVQRFGEKRIFAYQKKSLGRRVLDAIR